MSGTTPLILAFDTSAAHCAAALLCGDDVLAVHAEDMAKGQAERLMPMLEEMLAGAGYGWPELHRIGVGTGPGNFTGIRISVSAARGLALSLEIPAIGVTGFEAAALGHARPCAVQLPAMRGQVYRQIFENGGPQEPEILPEGADCKAPIVDGLSPAELALSIARIAAARPVAEGARPAPLYIRPADAAPPREAPPVILP
ncbi:tRNA (adenosine(37)-N6)-threonylcarbamoyltransferase complex dimerization subunit type 1 TsaB [Pseudoruegeria sp. HB172150]|uniref:tRNA (adenosine(37)-N6)-threonylcarbamoyltransferase complex dimerization subunit type 1 TsaB n=1 Tax=Pseudoruegeria sp. HB172150 TaxID=2721164 RepID=UPI001553F26C|nr:tRNA (adenosine(37)-N6)-threonylcarbamoyltransferase complex dimerization subunit type 1 TsaB [Pseudoruegeria sp. HB172150]